MIKADNLDEFFKGIDLWQQQVEAEVTAVAKNLASYALRHVLAVSPQYSGDFVANWNMSVGQPDTSFTKGVFQPRSKDFPPFLMGDLAAQNAALSRNTGRLNGFKLGQTIWISNTAHHMDFYSFKIENNEITFRAGNMGAPVERTMVKMANEFGIITKSKYGKLIS